jgi:hypothetical protein
VIGQHAIPAVGRYGHVLGWKFKNVALDAIITLSVSQWWNRGFFRRPGGNLNARLEGTDLS